MFQVRMTDKWKTAALAVGLAILAYAAAARPGPFARPTPAPKTEQGTVGSSELGGGPEKSNRVLGEFDLARLFPEIVLRQGEPRRKTVALTFDDGPDGTFTPRILDVLANKGVKGTFFLVGKRLDEHPEVVRRIVAEGHAVGNHTFSHMNITRFTLKEIEDEVRRADQALSKYGIELRGMFRPPYGAVDVSSAEMLGKAGYRLCLWSVDSLDWRGLNRDQVIGNVVPLVGNGSVVLFHSAGGPGEDLTGTVEALPAIIDDLRAKGYEFVTIPEMFPLQR